MIESMKVGLLNHCMEMTYSCGTINDSNYSEDSGFFHTEITCIGGVWVHLHQSKLTSSRRGSVAANGGRSSKATDWPALAIQQRRDAKNNR